MSDQKTSWILELVDQITKPAKSIGKIVKKMTDSIDEIGESVKLSEKDTREALTNSKKHYKELETQIKEVEKELKELERTKKSGDWAEQMEASKAFDKATERLERLRKALKGADEDVKDLTEQVDEFNRKSQKWTEIATGINQGVELIQKATDALDFSVDVARLTTEVQRMTDLTGDALDDFVKRSRGIATVYEEDAQDIARAANAMTKQNGGTYEENLKLIEEGFKRGANSNGDFIDSLKEYQPFIRQLGISQAQAIAIIAKAGKEGIYSDKAIDSLKEANMALREMQKPQVEALASIGIKPEDLIGKTTFEAVQMISQKMKGATAQARQLIIADIFKGAGEDAGLKWADELGTADFDLANLPSVEQAGSGFKLWFSNLSTWAGQAFGNIGIYAQELSPMIQTVAAAIPIVQMLSKVTWLNTIATNAWTIATKLLGKSILGIPIVGWILAIVSAIAWVVSATEGWGEAWEHTWNGAKNLFMAWISKIKAHWGLLVNGLMIGINKIQEGWYKFKEAVGLGDSSENQAMLAQIKEDTEQRKQAIVDGYAEAAKYGGKAAADFSQAINSIKWKDKKQEDQLPSVNDYATASPDLLGEITPDKKGKGKKEGDVLNVGSGSGGIKSITMTLNITNQFSVSKGTDMRSVADKIVSHVNDRLRDSVINLGA